VTVWRVWLTEPAQAELEAAYLSRSRFMTPEAALRWYEGLRAEIFGLAEWPRRCARVEATDYGYNAQTEVRRLRYGQGRGAFHVVYQVIEPVIEPGAGPFISDEQQEGQEGIVRVLHIVSAIRRPPGQSGQSAATHDEDDEDRANR
jgi:plasmid stabilization system protein ParE